MTEHRAQCLQKRERSDSSVLPKTCLESTEKQSFVLLAFLPKNEILCFFTFSLFPKNGPKN